MGEASHLTRAERIILIQSARRALNDAGLVQTPIIAGTGAGSTRETIELTKDAAAAGADYVLVIVSGYFAGVLATHQEALKSYWSEISQKSPVPVMIYNCESMNLGFKWKRITKSLQTPEQVGVLISTRT